MEEQYFHHALKIEQDKCIGCTHCMFICPTEAIRIREGKAKLFENRCVDCGECFRVCPVNAITIEQDDFNKIFNYRRRVALIPSVFIGQFPERVSVDDIIKVLLHIGFTDIFKIEHSIEVLLPLQKEYLKQHPETKPLISAFCPAIVRLIQVRFPAFVNNIILQRPPMEIAALYYREKLLKQGVHESDIGLFYITPCAAKIASVKSPVVEENPGIDGVINMELLYNKILSAITNKEIPEWDLSDNQKLTAEGLKWSLTSGEASNHKGRCLAIDGIRNVISFLEQLENEEIKDVDFLELRACDQSCAGGVLTPSDRFLTLERLTKCKENRNTLNQNNSHEIGTFFNGCEEKVEIGCIPPRSMMKLDDDVESAMRKLKRIRTIINCLPSVDCGVCGSPNCKAFAEDIVQDRAQLEYCIFIQKSLEQKNRINAEQGKQMIKQVWGNEKLESDC